MKMSTSLTFLTVLLLQLLHQSVLGADNNKAQFTLLTQFKCDGVAVCAVSQPNKSMSVTSKAQCVLYCQHQRQQPESCVGVNYQGQNNTCDVFYYEVTKFKKNVTGCQYIQKGSADNMNCLTLIPPILPSDCNDILNATGAKVNGVYTVYVGTNQRPLAVYCDMNTTSGGWTVCGSMKKNVFQRRKDGSVDFYRNWNDYTQGFGDVNGEFWIGNENLNLLTSSKRYKLRIDLADFNGNTRYAEYDNFTVNSAADKYRLSSLGKYSGTAGDSMAYHLGSQFSTYDKDHDTWVGGNCAVAYKGAWWFVGCHSSELNGQYFSPPQAPWYEGVMWLDWTGRYYSLKTAEMKIKPVN